MSHLRNPFFWDMMMCHWVNSLWCFMTM